MRRIILAQDEESLSLAKGLGKSLRTIVRKVYQRLFPDEESLVRVSPEVSGKEVLLVASLARPNPKIFPLLLTAGCCRVLGTRRLTLVSPYLPYMRQDKSFHPGEAVAARNFADLLGRYFDRLVTIDPHLHRIKSLQEIYKIPTLTVTATALLADFIKKKIEKPLLIGPDEESKQWIERIASKHRVDCVVLKKKRYGDRRVRVLWDRSIPIHGRTAVLVDDIVSSGGTMIELVGQLRGAGFRKIVCIAVHPIFAGDSFERLKKAGATLIASCNTIGHESNAIDITPLLAAHLRQGFTAR